ncbi:non-reducing end alpha-L-arabinofuranosidase family hydrolase [Streptomyces bluensis]|uniref:non-reducing end alpha-L-arabinofuranosidase family hydrolase n=1 Tax=Streptomyces bluensis TaxID=33897 RepID=UPI001673F289
MPLRARTRLHQHRHGRRYFRSWTSGSLAGSWTPLAASREQPVRTGEQRLHASSSTKHRRGDLAHLAFDHGGPSMGGGKCGGFLPRQGRGCVVSA